MKKKKIIALSVLLSGAILCNSSVSLLNSDFFLSSFYNVEVSNIVSDCKTLVKEWPIPLIDDMVPQGVTFVDEFILTTSYAYNGENNSCVYVLDNKGHLINVCDIGNKAHVGAIAFDEINSLIWITGENGTINVYLKNEILFSEYASPICSDLDVGEGLTNFQNPFCNTVSFLTVYDTKLFVGNFSVSGNGYIKKYDIDINFITGKLTLTYNGYIKIPDKVQGVTFYEDDGETYILFSKSYGKGINSLLQVFAYDDTIVDYRDESLNSVSLKMPAMMEQITVKDGKIYSIYESAALPYITDKYEVVDDICSVEIKPLVKELSLRKDSNF